MTRILVALLLAASAESTGRMSPTSDLSQNRVRATGSTTGRSLRDRFADQVNVKDFGAVGNGVANDTAAIQAALDHGAGSPIVVYAPKGTYKVFPADATGKNCLTINYDNVTLLGDGWEKTIISCYVSGGRDPMSNWDVVTGAVWRGSGIFVVGTTNPAAPRTKVRIEGLRLTGNCPRSTTTWPLEGSDPPYPASIATGDGWDITHKGFNLHWDQYFDDIVLRRVMVDGWKGEAVYYGGAGLDDITIEDSKIGDTNADAISMTGRMVLRRSEVYAATNAIENNVVTLGQVIEDNYFHDTAKGVVFTGYTDPGISTTVEPSFVSRNRFERNRQIQLRAEGYTRSVDIVGNTFIDGNADLIIDQPSTGAPRAIGVRDNEFRADKRSPAVGISLSGAMYDVAIERNRWTQSAAAVDGNFKVQKSIEFNLTAGSTVRVTKNDFRGARYAMNPQSPTTFTQVPLVVGDNDWTGTAPNVGGQLTAGGSYPLRPVYDFGYVTATTGGVWTTWPGMVTTNVPDKMRVKLTAWDQTHPIKMPKTGSGMKLKEDRFLCTGTPYPKWNYLTLEFSTLDSLWHEVEFGWYGTSAAAVTANDYYFALTETADTVAPTAKFYGATVLELDPTGLTTYTTFSDAPFDQVLTIGVNGNGVVQHGANFKLSGGTDFAPGGTGGVLFLYRRNGGTPNVLYEISRSTY